MNASMYALLLLAVALANLPFLSDRMLGVLPLKKKHIGHHLLELALTYVLLGLLAYALEARTGAVHNQNASFYVVTVLMFLVFAFPAFVWRYFWNNRHRQ